MAMSFKVPETGDVIAGKYRIEEQIGRGGFGVVFKAMQLGMERTVAIKTLLPQAMAHEDMVERFRREAVHARNLNHPNTIRLYDFGQTEGGLLYISMEFLDGKPLDSIIKHSGPISTARVKNIGVQILKALAEAHQNGIVHRDLKPANIFIIQVVGEDDFVKVLDFGIAKAFEAEEDEGKLTKTGIGFGTPFYMAPEQVRGRDICPATDLYALGLVLTECLTGETVYSGTSSMEIAVKQLSEEPPPIPEWVLRGPLGPVLQRATQKDIRTRYPSAVEMLRDLRAVDPNATIDISTRLNTGAIMQAAGQPAEKKKGLPLGLMLGLGAVALVILLLAGALGIALTTGLLDPPEAPIATTDGADKDPAAEDGKDKDGKDEDSKGEAGIGEGGEEGDDKAGEGKQEAPSATIVSSITTQPEGATVYNGEDFIGITPCKVTLDRAKGPFDLEARLEGFKTATIHVGADKDSSHKVELEVDNVVPDKAPDKVAGSHKPPKTPRSAIANKDAGKDDGKAADPKANPTRKPDDKPLIPKIGAGSPDKGKDKGAGNVSIPKL